MSGEFLQSLIRDGKVAGWWPFNAGHVQDLSGNNNHGTINGNCYFESDGLRFVDNTAYVNVPHHTSLNLTNVTMVLLKPEQRSSQVSSGGLQCAWLSKWSGGGGSPWYVYFGDYRLKLYDGTATRITGASYDDDERYTALSLAAAGGGTAIGYREGVSIGNFSGASTLAVNTRNLRIGWTTAAVNYDGTIQSVMLLNVALTESEHALLYADLIELEWPTCCHGHAERYQDVDKKESGLVAGWDMRPAGGVIPDQVGGSDGMIHGGAFYQSGILGNALKFNGVDGYIDCGNVGTIKSLAFWTNPETTTEDFIDLDGGTHTVEVVAGTITATGWVAVSIFVDGVATTALKAGLKQRVVISSATGFAASAVKLGKETIFLDGTMGNPEFFSTEKDVAWALADYLEGAKAIQFKIDWGMPVSPAQEGGILHQQIGTKDSPFQASDTTGRWKIETDTVNDQLCKVLTCTTTGKVYVKTSDFFDTTPTEAAFGTWDLWAYKANASTFNMNLISNLNTGITTGYGFTWAADESVVVYEYGVGNVVAGGIASHSTWHRFRLTRSSAGLFTPYIDNVVFGTPAIDLTTTTAEYTLFDMDAGDKLCLADVSGDECFYKMLGVNPA